MEYVYIGSVFAAGFLSVLLLALGGELRRQREVRSALSYFPGFRAAKVVYSGGAGLALDERAGAACLITSLGGQLKLTLVSFTDVMASEILSNGRRLLAAGRAAATGSDCDSDKVVFRMVARSGKAVDHAVVMPSMRQAVHWHALMKRVMEGAAEPKAVRKPPVVPATVTRPSAPVPVEPELSDDERVCLALKRYADEALAKTGRRVIAERTLRDACGVDLPIPEFHACMNRLRRAKAVPGVAMTYSRQGETWRLSRRAGG